MRSSRFSSGSRITALLAFSALIVLFLGPTVGFAADPDASGERCAGCPGCESGECGDDEENPLGSHHHCCTTCCMSHTSYALPTPLSYPVSAITERMQTSAPVAVTGRTPETPYRPPRV